MRQTPASMPVLSLLLGAVLVLGMGCSVAIAGDKELGKHLSAECVACHQLSGRVVGGVPAIVGVDAQSFVALMNSYRTKQRDNQVMQSIAAKFSDEEIAALAAYFGSIKPK